MLALMTAALAVLQATPAAASAPTAAVPESRAPVAQTRVGTVPLRRDHKGRPTSGVEINGRGPFDMVVDTAAQVSLVTASLASELALPKLGGGVAVAGATGSQDAGFYGIDSLSSPLFELRQAALPMLPNAGVTDARGILGLDALGGRKLTFATTAGTLSVGPSGPPAKGFVAIAGRRDAAGMLVVPITIDGRQVDALVDTGAEGTVAGSTLIDLLGWGQDDPRLKAFGTVGGAGQGARAAKVATVGKVQVGPVRFSNVPVVIVPGGDSEGAGARPQVILGANLLNMLSAYAVDFGRAELQVAVPRRP